MTDQEAFGRPINGEITYYTGRSVEQQDPQLWINALDDLLALDVVDSVRWRQYTPYFNDGDPCEFTIYDATVLLKGFGEDDDRDGLGDYGDNYLDTYSLKYNSDQIAVRYPELDLSERGELYQKLRHFSTAVAGGAHFVMLQQTFGDPAQVTATPEGFDVEFYEHD